MIIIMSFANSSEASENRCSQRSEQGKTCNSTTASRAQAPGVLRDFSVEFFSDCNSSQRRIYDSYVDERATFSKARLQVDVVVGCSSISFYLKLILLPNFSGTYFDLVYINANFSSKIHT